MSFTPRDTRYATVFDEANEHPHITQPIFRANVNEVGVRSNPSVDVQHCQQLSPPIEPHVPHPPSPPATPMQTALPAHIQLLSGAGAGTASRHLGPHDPVYPCQRGDMHVFDPVPETAEEPLAYWTVTEGLKIGVFYAN